MSDDPINFEVPVEFKGNSLTEIPEIAFIAGGIAMIRALTKRLHTMHTAGDLSSASAEIILNHIEELGNQIEAGRAKLEKS